MAFLDDMDRKLSQLGQSALRKTKDMSESMRLSGEIREEEEKQKELCRKIGEYIYENHIGPIDEQIDSWCVEITQSRERIVQSREQIQILKGTSSCPRCGSPIASDAAFCSSCGCRIDEEMKKTAMKNSTGAVCPNCGKSVESGAVFCTFCGTRISDVETADVREEIPEDICPNCGVQIKPGQLFCVKCGAKLQG